MSASADPEAIGSYLRTAETGRTFLHDQVRLVLALADDVRARAGDRAVWGEALEDLAGLLAAMEENEQFVADTRQRLLQADGSSDPVGGSPWLDPSTGSWVVNLVRLGGGGTPTPSFIQRVVDEGPGVASALGEFVSEFTIQRQTELLLTDPSQFTTNWLDFGAGVGDAVSGMATVGLGAASLLSPGIAQVTEDLTGTRADVVLLQHVIEAGRLLAVDPDAFGEAALGWEQLQTDPYRWLGSQVPDVIIELLSAGAGSAVIAGRLARLRTVSRGIDNLPSLGPGTVPGRTSDDLLDLVVAGDDEYRLPDLDRYRQSETEWGEAGPILSHREGLFEPPEEWIGEINAPGRDASTARTLNCLDCARAVEANWRGYDAVAAPVAPGRGRGVGAELLEDWSGGRLEPTTLPDIEQRLDELGPGSSAMVVSRWDGNQAHAYNALNVDGDVKWVDGQSGQVDLWPPPYAEGVEATLAIFIGPDGHPQLTLG